MCSASRRPTAEADAPSAVNTTEKPSTKNTEPRPARRRTSERSAPFESSSSESPDMNETYPGTSGSTQGERKDATPAAKAAGTERETAAMRGVYHFLLKNR